MDLNSINLQQHSAAYIESHLESRQELRPGTGSAVVAIIGGVAAAMRRAATRIEAWSHGSSEESGRRTHAIAR